MSISTLEESLPLDVQVRGAVKADNLYIRRESDMELSQALQLGEICYVLGPRQIGKTSLCKQIVRDLPIERYRTIWLDMSVLSSGRSEKDIESWYYGIIRDIAAQIEIDDEQIELFWLETQKLSFEKRWFIFLSEQLLHHVTQNIIIFIDEIDAVRSLKFHVDGFFHVIRAAFNERANQSKYKRLTFCLLGSTTPTELSRPGLETPFNIGRPITITDFTKEESYKYINALKEIPEHQKRAILVDCIYSWTSGHPYMTARLVKAVKQKLLIRSNDGMKMQDMVNGVVEEIFLRAGRASDDNLRETERRINFLSTLDRHSYVDVESLLRMYQQVLAGKLIRARPLDPLQSELRVCGLCRWDGSSLSIRNRIFENVFNNEWLQGKLAERELDIYFRNYRETGKASASLLKGQFLIHAQAWAIGRFLTDDERELIQKSARAAEQKQRILNVIQMLGFVAVAIFSGLMTNWHWKQLSESQKREFIGKIQNEKSLSSDAKENFLKAESQVAACTSEKQELKISIDKTREQYQKEREQYIASFEKFYKADLDNLKKELNQRKIRQTQYERKLDILNKNYDKLLNRSPADNHNSPMK